MLGVIYTKLFMFCDDKLYCSCLYYITLLVALVVTTNTFVLLPVTKNACTKAVVLLILYL